MRFHRTGTAAFDYSIGVREYRVSITDNIERKYVGGSLNFISWGDILHQSTITIKGSRSIVSSIRSAITTCAKAGLSFKIECEEFEPIFGPEFDYATGVNLISGFMVVSDTDTPYTTDSSPDSVNTEWTLTIAPMISIIQYLKYQTEIGMPSLRIESVSRKASPQTTQSNYYNAQSSNGFGVSELVSIVSYAGARELVSKGKAFLLLNALTNYVTINFGTRVWLFEDSVHQEDVYLLAIDDLGPLSKGSDEFMFSATFARK